MGKEKKKVNKLKLAAQVAAEVAINAEVISSKERKNPQFVDAIKTMVELRKKVN